MSFSGGRTSSVMYSSLLVLLIIISVLHIWVFSEGVGALRILPESRVALEKEVHQHHQKLVKSNSKKKSHTQLFRDYFNQRVSDLNSTYKQDNGTFQESKRRVPSCPDPLHNK